MLIDSKHKPWALWTAILAVVALGLYLFLNGGRFRGELTGGTRTGLYYGVVGSVLMLLAGFLAALKRFPAASWLGSRRRWLRFHIWFGSLSALLILCHSGFRFGGPLEIVLMTLFGLTLLSGVVGLILQQFLPRMLSLRVTSEAPYEQIPHICQVLCGKGDAVLQKVFAKSAGQSQASIMVSQMGLGAKLQLQKFYDEEVRPFLAPVYRRSSRLAKPFQAPAVFDRIRALPGLVEVKDEVQQLESLCEERRQLAEQERLHYWLHSWLLVHIPLSAALLVAALAHVWFSLYY